MLLSIFMILAWSGQGAVMGVMLQPLDKELKDSYGYQGEGVLVNHVVEGLGASNAGIEAGDIIAKINATQVHEVGDITKVLGELHEGDTAVVEYIRNGDRLKANVILSPMALMRAERPHKLAVLYEDRAYLGVEFQKLNEQLARYFEVESGILVTRVLENTAAERSGLVAGDVITAVNGNKIEGDLHEVLQSFKPDDEVNLTVFRKGTQMDLSVTLDRFARGHEMRWQDASGNVFFGRSDEDSLHPLIQDFSFLQDDLESIHDELKKLRQEVEQLRNRLDQR